MSTPIARPFYMIEPHTRWMEEGDIDLTEIASRVYGKPFNVLRSVQMSNDSIGNDQYHLVFLSSDEDYEQALFNADEKRIYLGFDRATMSGVFHEGHTAIEYWQSVRWAGLDGLTDADATVDYNPPETQDCYGAIFPGDEDFARRHVSPGIDLVLADLIRKGELPRGDYIIKHWW